MSNTLASVGELRTAQLLQLHRYRDTLDVLASAPGFRELPDAAKLFYADLHKPLSARLSQLLQDHLIGELAKEIDQLDKGPDWGARLAEWVASVRSGRCRVRFFEERLLHTRLISEAERSLVFAHPFGAGPDSDVELRLAVEGAEHQRIRQWFNDRFESSVDVSDRVARCIEESWAGALLTPTEAYRKVLASYFDEVLISLDREYDANPMLARLTEFQVDAYHYAKFILRRYGGVFLADVVGLGKTFIAIALLKHLQDTYRYHGVVVAPPNIIPAWRDLASEHRVEVAFVSMGKLSELPRYGDREVLVVDESHNFRNSNTRRFEELSSWVRPQGEAATRKVLLLSATPQNNSITDIRHQLSLFPDNHSALPIKSESLEEWCKEVRNGTRTATDLLQHVVVRRTRRYIREAFPNATIEVRTESGERTTTPLRFPTRVSGPEQCLRYSLTDTYHGQLYAKILVALGSLTYPLHSLGEFLNETGAEHSRTRGLRRTGTSVRGLFKVLLLKRLESSFLAFRESAKSLEGRLRAMLDAIAEGNVPPVRDLDISDEDDSHSSSSDSLPLEFFDTVRLRKAVHEDLLEVRGLLTLVSDLDAHSDAKLQRLVEYLARRPPAAHKTIVFTQFADTAHYIGTALRARGHRLEVVTGGVANALGRARRFSPRSNRYTLGANEDEVPLLVSTDVLSEGVNLQDADTLVNYDLHWNPVRLIQRAGRIDRIGSEHEMIEIASFLPEKELEAGLGLEEVLRRRIREFIEVFGEDSGVLPAEAAPQETEMVRAYSGEALASEEADDDELDGLSRHQERLLRFRREEPEEYMRVLHLRPGRFACSEGATPVAASRVGNFWYFWRAGNGEVVETSARVALDAFFDNTRLQGRERPTSKAWSTMGAVQERFLECARTLRSQQGAPRMSPSLLALLESLERLADSSPEHQKALILETREWVRRRAGHPTVERAAHHLRWQAASPQEALGQCRRLVGTVSAPADELGEATIVAASLDVPAADGIK